MVSTFSSVSSKRRRARGAHALDEVCRTDVQPCTKQAAQRSLRDSGLCCQSVGPPIGERMRGCSLRELLNFAVADRLRGQLRGELALPPGRIRKTTCRRAIARATFRPRSTSIIASAKSIPAVTPADVQMPPSSIWIASPSTSTAERNRFSASTSLQWVVARRPSRAPAAAKKNVPLHTDAIRGTRPIALDTMSVADPRASSWRIPGSPPTVKRVWVRVSRLFVICANATSATSRSPDDVVNGPACGAAISMR